MKLVRPPDELTPPTSVPSLEQPLARHIDNVDEEQSKLSSVRLEQMEVMVARVWFEVLSIDQPELTPDVITRDLDFFDVGGDSFQAAQVISILEQELGIPVPVSTFFEPPTTVARMSSRLV